jgi:hypothetical protein
MCGVGGGSARLIAIANEVNNPAYERAARRTLDCFTLLAMTGSVRRIIPCEEPRSRPGSALHRFTMQRVRDNLSAQAAS